MLYKQCRLVRENSPTSTTTTITWLPSKYAKLGEVVTLKDSGTFTVQYVGEPGMDEKYLPDPHRDAKSLWKATSGPIVVGHK